MYFIKIELRRSYGVTAIALWPVIEKNCDAVTDNYDKKTVVTRRYNTKIVTMRKSVRVFGNFRFFSWSATLYGIILCHWTPVDEQWSLTRTIWLVLSYLLNIPTHTHDTKSPLPIPFAKSSHILKFREKFSCKIIFYFFKISEKFFCKLIFLNFSISFWQKIIF